MLNRTEAPRRGANTPHILIVLILALILTVGGSTGCSSAGAATGSAAQAVAGSSAIGNAHAGTGAENAAASNTSSDYQTPATSSGFDYSQVPAYSGSPYAVINDNAPNLNAADAEALPAQASSPAEAEKFSPLDSLGRCGAAMAVVSPDTQPTEPRGSIGMIKPSGWHTVRYDDLVDGRYLYNRCHLIGYQLTGEGTNELNLITGTRYMNTQGMLPFENWIDGHVDAGGRVLLRVEPVFADDELVARGVHMEALSLDDDGASVSFNVFCYNVQPGVGIDYATGDSWREQDAGASTEPAGTAAQSNDEQARTYVLNTNTRKFHLPGCRSVSRMKARNKQEVTMTRSEVMTRGYEPCAQCNP